MQISNFYCNKAINNCGLTDRQPRANNEFLKLKLWKSFSASDIAIDLEQTREQLCPDCVLVTDTKKAESYHKVSIQLSQEHTAQRQETKLSSSNCSQNVENPLQLFLCNVIIYVIICLIQTFSPLISNEVRCKG